MTVTTTQLDTRVTALEKLAVKLTADEVTAIVAAFAKNLNLGGTTSAPVATGGSGTTPAPATKTARLELNLSSSPGSPSNNTVAILVDGKSVKAPVGVTPHVGAALPGSLSVVLDVPWTDKSKVDIIGIAPNGINGLWMNAANIDYVPLVANGVYDSQGRASVNAAQVFISNGANLTLTLPIAVEAPPPPPPVVPMTVIVGAKINGAVHADAILSALVAATPAGGTLKLPEGIITGTSAVPVAMTIKGAGKDKTFIDGTGITPIYQKGGFVPLVPGVVFQDMTIRNFAVSDLNGAGIRDNDEGIGFNCARVLFKGNQDGVLTYTANYDFDDCDFEGNGAGDGYSHNFYVNGSPTSVLTMTNCRSSAPKGGHAGKSRAGTTSLTNCDFTTGGDGSGLDVPNGGNLTIIGGSTALGGSMDDRFLIGHAMENRNNAAAGHTVHIKDHVFHNGSGQAAYIQTADPDGILILENATYTGNDINLVGWKSITGSLTKAA